MLKSNLKVVLAEENMKNKELAERLGVSVNVVSKWVNDVHYPPASTLFKIARVLNRKVDDLYTYKEE